MTMRGTNVRLRDEHTTVAVAILFPGALLELSGRAETSERQAGRVEGGRGDDSEADQSLVDVRLAVERCALAGGDGRVVGGLAGGRSSRSGSGKEGGGDQGGSLEGDEDDHLEEGAERGRKREVDASMLFYSASPPSLYRLLGPSDLPSAAVGNPCSRKTPTREVSR